MNFSIGAAALAFAFALVGCGPQSGDLQQLNQNEFTLRGMIASDRQQIDALQQQIKRQNDEITELKHGASGAGGDASSLGDKVAKLETEVSALQAGMAATPTETPPTWPSELDQELADAAKSGEPGIKIYRQGLEAMKAHKYPLAVTYFTKLQHSYPKSALSEPAEYFAANALYETGEYDKAILQFNDLVMRFPKGKYASAALLREAQAFLKLNDRIDARLTLQKLVADHGGTPEATAANTMMKDLASD